MSSSQSTICSLVFSTSSVATASSLGHVFARPSKSKSKPIPHQHTKTTEKSSGDQKGPLKRFRLFPKNKRSWMVSSPGHIFPPTTVYPLIVSPELITIDDDASSIYSDTSMFLGGLDRKNSSVPNLTGQTSWDNSPSLSVSGFGYKHRSLQAETLHEEEEDEDVMEQDQKQADGEEEELNWDSQSDNGCLETSALQKRSSLPTPVPIAVPNRRHRRAMSLPQSSIQDLPPSLFDRRPTASEVWDDDFLLETNEVNVPQLVEDAQVFIRMDISNIRDFTTQIEELKTLRKKKTILTASVKSKITKRWPNGFTRKSSKKLKNLEETFKTHWEEADVIIYVSDVAQDQQSTFNGGKSVELGLDRMPSERHLEVLRKIIDEQLVEEDIWPTQFGDLLDEDENKENKENMENIENRPMSANSLCEDTIQQSSYSPKKSRMNGFGFSNFYGLKRNNSGQVNGGLLKKKRRDDVRISVDEMPSLIEYLRNLQRRLTEHVYQLDAMKDE